MFGVFEIKDKKREREKNLNFHKRLFNTDTLIPDLVIDYKHFMAKIDLPVERSAN